MSAQQPCPICGAIEEKPRAGVLHNGHLHMKHDLPASDVEKMVFKNSPLESLRGIVIGPGAKKVTFCAHCAHPGHEGRCGMRRLFGDCPQCPCEGDAVSAARPWPEAGPDPR